MPIIDPAIIYSCIIALFVFLLLIRYERYIGKCQKQTQICKSILNVVTKETFFDLEQCKYAQKVLTGINSEDLPDYMKDYIDNTLIALENTIEVYENLGEKSKDLESILKEMNLQVEQMLNYVKTEN